MYSPFQYELPAMHSNRLPAPSLTIYGIAVY